jgi:DNA-binding MarR family transcriptional regulator/GNAT superfamily N-acetyltransferase
MSAKLPTQHVDAVRSFNRFYTKQIGVLEEGLLESPFTLTQGRVLFEIAHARSVTAKQIGDSLGLDAGYLSRILQGFVKRRLIQRTRSKQDARQYVISLTQAGQRVFTSLDKSSHRSISQMLSRLPRPDRDRLLASLNEVQSTLGGRPHARLKEVTLRAHRAGDIGWAIERHGQLYADEYQWTVEFEALVAQLFGKFAAKHDPKTERMWIAEIDGERVGCVFVVQNEDDSTAAQLRCLLVDPKGRGLGVGRRLVRECIAFATAAGYKKMVLWTNDVLVAARRLYEAEGFTLIQQQRHRNFGHDLVGQTWMRPLTERSQIGETS